MRLHSEAGSDRLWLRVWDEDLPERDTFELPESYAVDASWRVAARLDLYPEPRPLRLTAVTDGKQEYETLGELVFRKEGREHRLIAVARGTQVYGLALWDSTATETTYQAGRYLVVPVVDEDGWTMIDFNRAFNPPCAFTAFATCALPPRWKRRLAQRV